MNNGNGHAVLTEAPCLEAALGYHDMGLPIVLTEEKSPQNVMGKGWQHKRFASGSEIEQYFRNDPSLNVGLILGPASGIVDLECDDDKAEGDFASLFDGCEPTTPPTYLATRGRHRLFAYHPKLEMIADLPGCQDNQKGAVVKYGHLECRVGVGHKAAQSLLPPSTTGGNTRQWVEGLSLDECPAPELTEIVVDRIIAAAAEKFKRNEPPIDSEGRCLGGRPGDDFNARATWETAFGDSGWEYVNSSGKVSYWRRPGKREGTSGTTGHCANDTSGELFYCFTSNAEPLQAETAYSKFAVFALLHHGGDFGAAATALAAQGYGDAELNLWKAEGRTDTANSKRFVATHGRDVRYCALWNQWLAWDDRRWRIDDVRRTEDLAKQIGRQVWAEVADAAKKTDDDDRGKLLAELTKWAKYSAGGKGIREMLGLARSAPEVVVLPEALDTHPMLLCCENGTIDLTTGNLRPHRREDYLTKFVPVKFDANARAPTWERFIGEVFDGNRELVSFIQRAAGYTLTGDTSERCLFFAWGKGKNGKTTLVSALQKLLGDYGVTVTMDLLTVDMKKGIPAEVVDLFGARMAVANETEDANRLAESFLKSMTGGEDKQKGRRLYQQFFEFEQTHKLWICGNHKPRIRGTDDGVWDRIRLIPFNVRFEKPDKQLPKKLAAEREGILRWCVEGALAWKRDGLGEPKAVTDATAEYRTECDTIGTFLSWCCFVGTEYKARAGDLFAAYRKWCEANGEFVLSQTRFGKAIAERFNKYTNNGVWYSGVGLKNAETEGF